MRHVYPWLKDASSFSFIIPFIVSLFYIRGENGTTFKLLLLFVGFLALTEVAGQLSVYLGTQNNIWIGHIYTPIELLLLASLYYINLKNALIKKALLIVTGLLFMYSLFYLFAGDNVLQMNSLPRMLNAAVLISLAALYLYQTANEPVYMYLDRDPMFLLSSGVILYQAGTAMAYSMFNQALAESYDAARMCITVMLVLNIIFRIILALALARASKA